MSEPPFALDGSVTRERLLELLAVQTELVWLDYKGECDLTAKAELVELTKDVGAMMIRAGYLVVGADGRGRPTGQLTRRHAALFDEAALTGKVGKYLPTGFEIRSAVHVLPAAAGEQLLAVVWVGPHPDGWCVFTRNGDYTDEQGKQRTAFRVGDVYARHGTSSEPWDQTDIAHARAQLVARAKETWRTEHSDELRRALRTVLPGAAMAAGPSDTFTWQVDAGSFETAAVELLRRDDDVPVRRMLRAAGADAARLAAAGGDATEEVSVLLDRVAALAALALELRRPRFTTVAVDALLQVFDWAVRNQYATAPGQLPASVVWLRIAERLYALGALAVRLRDWSSVRALALAPVPALEAEARGRTWHRHALTHASRDRLFITQPPGKPQQEVSLLMFAAAVAAAPLLHPDLLDDAVAATGGVGDRLLTSICQFDFLVTVLSGADASASTATELLAVSYPNFARFDGRRVGGVARALTQPPAREALLPGVSDHELAVLLRLADQVAEVQSRSYFGWDGYTDAAVQAFIDARLGAKG